RLFPGSDGKLAGWRVVPADGGLGGFLQARPRSEASFCQERVMSDVTTQLSVTEHGDIRVVEFTDKKILDEGNITEIGSRINELIDQQSRPRLLLDFGHVEHLSSAALGMLINANNRIREKNG